MKQRLIVALLVVSFLVSHFSILSYGAEVKDSTRCVEILSTRQGESGNFQFNIQAITGIRK